MVTTRSQAEHSNGKHPRTAPEESTAPRDKKARTAVAKCEANQPLLNALQDLLNAVSSAVKSDPNERFHVAQLHKVISALAELDSKVTSGEMVASGDHKIEGLGEKTAEYIDDFLENGKIAATEEYQERASDAKESSTNESASNQKDSSSNSNIIHINRAPILGLWATIVSERQGYSHDEALTHAKWIQFITARAKGKKLGKFDDSDKDGGGAPIKPKLKEHVFGSMKIPVKSSQEGQRFAVQGRDDEVIDPAGVERYFQDHLGNDLEPIKAAFQELANSREPKELRDEAYDLYEKLRPEWQGWGKPGKMDLRKVRELAQH